MPIEAKASVRFNVPPEAIFAHIGDPTMHDTWSAKAPLKVQKIGDDPVGVGSAFRSTSKFLGKPVSAQLTITQYDPPKRIAFTAEHGEGTYEHDFTLEEHEGGTLVTRRVTIPAPPGLKGLLARFVAPTAIAREAVKALQRLRSQIEST